MATSNQYSNKIIFNNQTITAMAEKFQNKYRTASARAAWWNYGWSGAYFITICTAHRKHFFGEIEDHKMQLTGIGILADVFWHEIKYHAKNVELGAFTVMPNHIHGILILDNPQDCDVNVRNEGVDHVGGNVHVETRHALPLQQPPSSSSPPQQLLSPPLLPSQQRFQNQGQNTVSSIVGSYKSAITKHANRLGLTYQDTAFGWQPKFHDHIIRNDEEYLRINDYIENNPQNWEKDKFFADES
jgi:putative transposase